VTILLHGIGFGLVTASIIALASVAFSLQFSVTTTPNFAHGELLTVGAYGALIAQTLTQMTSAMSADQLKDMLSALVVLFREFGDDSQRADAAWGWRVVGNAILACGQPGREILEAMRTERRGADQRQDRWLAWVAYQVLCVPQSPEKATLCEEKEAVETHTKYAPPFPGWRV